MVKLFEKDQVSKDVGGVSEIEDIDAGTHCSPLLEYGGAAFIDFCKKREALR